MILIALLYLVVLVGCQPARSDSPFQLPETVVLEQGKYDIPFYTEPPRLQMRRGEATVSYFDTQYVPFGLVRRMMWEIEWDDATPKAVNYYTYVPNSVDLTKSRFTQDEKVQLYLDIYMTSPTHFIRLWVMELHFETEEQAEAFSQMYTETVGVTGERQGVAFLRTSSLEAGSAVYRAGCNVYLLQSWIAGAIEQFVEAGHQRPPTATPLSTPVGLFHLPEEVVLEQGQYEVPYFTTPEILRLYRQSASSGYLGNSEYNPTKYPSLAEAKTVGYYAYVPDEEDLRLVEWALSREETASLGAVLRNPSIYIQVRIEAHKFESERAADTFARQYVRELQETHRRIALYRWERDGITFFEDDQAMYRAGSTVYLLQCRSPGVIERLIETGLR